MRKEFYIFIIILALLFPISILVEEKIDVPGAAKNPEYINMVFAGDIMLDRGVKNSVLKNFEGDYSQLFKNMDFLKTFDIVFANLEGTASFKGKNAGSIYSFHMDPAIIPILKNEGFNILSVANNHIGDWGLAAFTDTLARLKENNLLYTGGGMDKKEAETPVIIEKYGMKIGFLGFSDKGPDYMQAEENKAGILLASDPNFNQIIKDAAKQVDYLIVSFHFGEEYQPIHNARQEYLAHRAIDDGAKIIIGSHPHVVEDTEIYNPKACAQSSCASFIAYSLGNFIFDQSWSEPTMQGMLLEIKLYKDGSMTTTKIPTQLNSFFQLEKIN